MDLACQAPLFMEFSRQEYWSRLPLPQPGVDPGTESVSLAAPELAGGFFTTSTIGEAHEINYKYTCTHQTTEQLHSSHMLVK